jgi:hypothetical protein
MARNIDSADLIKIRRKRFNYRVECEFDDNGILVSARCHRVEQTRQNGTVLSKRYDLKPIDLSLAELVAAAPQIQTRIESLDGLADAKEILLETPAP